MERQVKIIRKMLSAAEADEPEMVLDLNETFDKIHLEEKPGMDEDVALELDRTRQSCVGAVTMIHLRDTFLADAHARIESLTGQVSWVGPGQ